MPNTNCSASLKRYLHDQTNKLIDALRTAIKSGKVRDEDYPKVSIACEFSNHRAYGHSYKCHSSIKKKVTFVIPLQKALSFYGNPPTVKKDPVSGKVLFVGTCAEDFAANEVLEKSLTSRMYPKLNSLVFTEPIRTRTRQRMKFCDVCKAIF